MFPQLLFLPSWHIGAGTLLVQVLPSSWQTPDTPLESLQLSPQMQSKIKSKKKLSNSSTSEIYATATLFNIENLSAHHTSEFIWYQHSIWMFVDKII